MVFLCHEDTKTQRVQMKIILIAAISLVEILILQAQPSKSYDQKITGSGLIFRMVAIPSGKFQIGTGAFAGAAILPPAVKSGSKLLTITHIFLLPDD